MRKLIRYLLLIVVIGIVGYKSVYIKKLSDVKKGESVKFDPMTYSQRLWTEKFPARLDSAIELSGLIRAVSADKESSFQNYSNALAIGNYRYALVKTSATISELGEDETTLQIPVGDSVINAILATEYIYGNAIRDASGLVDVKDFPNTPDLNGISEGLNKIVRDSVIPKYKAVAKKGDKLNIIAAIELNKNHIKWSGIELIPLRLEIIK